jgi:hypothetical protein
MVINHTKNVGALLVRLCQSNTRAQACLCVGQWRYTILQLAVSARTSRHVVSKDLTAAWSQPLLNVV